MKDAVRYRAVLFDLFGTLVGSLTRREHDQVNAKMAAEVGVPYADFWQLMGETYQDRCLGRYDTYEDLLWYICRRTGVTANTNGIAQAAELNRQFMANALVPRPEVMETLDELKRRGFRTGLISNCGPAVSQLFPRSPLARGIDIPVFSCDERVAKPADTIYQRTCQRLKTEPEFCIYVGDGSNQELTGAAALGMLPVLKRTDLSDVYDSHRPEVETWTGLAVDEIPELLDLDI